MTKTGEYERFTDLVQKLVKVPHSEIKAKLDEEKKQKKLKRKRKSAEQ